MVDASFHFSEVIRQIVASNNEFVNRHQEEFFSPFQEGQNPYITLISCSDSRVQPHVLLPDAINRIFEIENIGNQIQTSEGSVDYGVLHLKTPVLLILGHSDCGAIKAFMQGYQQEPVSIKQELNHLLPALTSQNQAADFEKKLTQNILKNVDFQVNQAVSKYSTVVKNGQLTVVGAVYDFKNEFERGYGRLVIVNVNGETDRAALKAMPQFQSIPPELRDSALGREK